MTGAFRSVAFIVSLALLGASAPLRAEDSVERPFLVSPQFEGYSSNVYPARAKNLDPAKWWVKETREFVKKKLKPTLLAFVTDPSYRAAAEYADLDPALEPAIAAGLEADIIASEFELADSCTSDDGLGLARTGSAVNGVRGGTICIAIPKLFEDMTRWQSMVIHYRAVALALHELFRHFDIRDSDHVYYNRAKDAYGYALGSEQGGVKWVRAPGSFWKSRTNFKAASSPLPALGSRGSWPCELELLPEFEAKDRESAAIRAAFAHSRISRMASGGMGILIQAERKFFLSESPARTDEWVNLDSFENAFLELVARSRGDEIVIEMRRILGEDWMIPSASVLPSPYGRGYAAGYFRCAPPASP